MSTSSSSCYLRVLPFSEICYHNFWHNKNCFIAFHSRIILLFLSTHGWRDNLIQFSWWDSGNEQHKTSWKETAAAKQTFDDEKDHIFWDDERINNIKNANLCIQKDFSMFDSIWSQLELFLVCAISAANASKESLTCSFRFPHIKTWCLLFKSSQMVVGSW